MFCHIRSRTKKKFPFKINSLIFQSNFLIKHRSYSPFILIQCHLSHCRCCLQEYLPQRSSFGAPLVGCWHEPPRPHLHSFGLALVGRYLPLPRIWHLLRWLQLRFAPRRFVLAHLLHHCFILGWSQKPRRERQSSPLSESVRIQKSRSNLF